MDNVLGYLKWQFSGITRSMTFWGLIVASVGIVAQISGCPMPWPARIGMFGLGMVIGDAVFSWVRFSYQLYKNEQARIVRELERK